MQEIKIGVVGLGHRGRHMALLAERAFECAHITAACDILPELWHQTQWLQDAPMKELLPQCRFYEDYSEMLRQEKLDLVLVETGADVHAEFCIKALERNINVFSDIPSVANLDEANRLWQAEQASLGKVMTGANPNEWGFVNAMADLYKRGLLGEPYYMEAEYVHCYNAAEAKHLFANNSWRNSLPPIRYCTHSLGPLLRIMREDLRYAICVGTGKHINQEARRDDMMAALFQTESGVTIRLLRNGTCNAAIGHHSYRVFGTQGYFERVDARGKQPPVTRFSSRMTYASSDTLTELPVDMLPPEYVGNELAQGHGGADYALLDHMFAAMLAKQAMPISLREGLRMTLPGIYAAESARLGGEKLVIHYPWEKEFAQDIALIDRA